MGKNYFTKEQVEELAANPYVERVSEKSITYTEEFKEDFYREYSKGIKTVSQILLDMGFKPRVLGKKRRESIVQNCKKYASRPDGFKDTRNSNSGRPRVKELSKDEEIALLKHKLEVSKQEIDFLKRVRFINKQQISKLSKKKDQSTNSN